MFLRVRRGGRLAEPPRFKRTEEAGFILEQDERFTIGRRSKTAQCAAGAGAQFSRTGVALSGCGSRFRTGKSGSPALRGFGGMAWRTDSARGEGGSRLRLRVGKEWD